MADNQTYDSFLSLNLGQVPEGIEDPILYQELLDIHDAIERLASVAVDGEIGETMLQIAQGEITGLSHTNKFGFNGNVNATVSTASPEDIWTRGGAHVPPTADRTHQIVSDSIQDKGTLVGTYTSTTHTATGLIDSGATFIADGVAVGDIVMNDTTQDHTVVTAVISETEIETEYWHHTEDTNVGDVFRIATSAGTGAAVFHVKIGWSKLGESVREFIILNGTTNVPTTKSYFRSSRAHIHGAGSNGTNVGTISMTADTDATVTLEIAPSAGQTLMAIDHVPQGYRGYITGLNVSMYRDTKISDAMAKVGLMSRLWGSTDDGEVVEYYMGVSISAGGGDKEFIPPKSLSQGTDIWIRCNAATDNDTEIAAGFDLILEKI